MSGWLVPKRPVRASHPSDPHVCLTDLQRHASSNVALGLVFLGLRADATWWANFQYLDDMETRY